MTKKQLSEYLFSRSKVTKSGCWEWQMYRDAKGYGRATFRNIQGTHVNRLAAYVWLGFNIRSKKFVCHKCDNPPCINPAHLFIGTNTDNQRDSIRKGRFRGGAETNRQKTHCPQGHPHSPDNIVKKRRWRECRICRIKANCERDRRRRERLRLGG